MKSEQKMTAKHLRSLILCFALFLSIAFLAGWLQWSGNSAEFGRPDVEQYIKASNKLNSADAPYRYRPWTPLLTRVVPDPPERWLSADFPVERQRIFFRFLIVNAIGLGVAATTLRYLGRRLTDSDRCGWLAALLFLFSFYPLTLAMLPMVEAWSYAWLAIGLLAMIRRQPLALMIAMLFGLFCKETTMLLIPAAMLLPSDRRQRVGQLLALSLPMIGYLLFRRFGFPPSEPLYSVESTGAWLNQLFVSREKLPGHLWRIAIAFHLLWIPALHALWKRRAERDRPLIRWALLIPIVMLIPFAFALVPGRLWFFAFPVVLPLAALGLRD